MHDKMAALVDAMLEAKNNCKPRGQIGTRIFIKTDAARSIGKLINWFIGFTI